jgi:hypothetical protein
VYVVVLICSEPWMTGAESDLQHYIVLHVAKKYKALSVFVADLNVYHVQMQHINLECICSHSMVKMSSMHLYIQNL